MTKCSAVFPPQILENILLSSCNNSFVLFCLRFYFPVNSYGHVEMVSSHNHIFPGHAGLSGSHILLLVTDSKPSCNQWKLLGGERPWK